LPVESLNHTLFLALNASASPPAPLVVFALVAAQYLILLVPLHIVLVWAGGTRAMRFLAVTAVVALTLALLLNGIVGLLVYTPRPFILGIGHTLIEHRPSASFPSNHATVVFTYAMTLALFSARRLALVVACMGGLVAWSRIYLGVHFPFDMAGAALVSAVVSFGSLHGMLRYGRPLFGCSDRLHSSLCKGGHLQATLRLARTTAVESIRGVVNRAWSPTSKSASS
jgi:undecaprenyl-diphosphatase